jgi:hypothetical protein
MSVEENEKIQTSQEGKDLQSALVAIQ